MKRHSSQVINGIKSLHRSHCFGVINLGNVQCSRINLPAAMLAVLKTKGAQPYLLSYKEIGRCGKYLQTWASCHIAFSIGDSQLVIRSCRNGNAPLRCDYGIQVIVLYPRLFVIGRFPPPPVV